jgi:hypothetical protein
MQPNVMSAARNDLTNGLWSKLLLLAGALALLTESASAQIQPKLNTPLQKEQKKLTPEQQKYQKELDQSYDAAQKKIPVQQPKDPWADVRSAPAALPLLRRTRNKVTDRSNLPCGLSCSFERGRACRS